MFTNVCSLSTEGEQNPLATTEEMKDTWTAGTTRHPLELFCEVYEMKIDNRMEIKLRIATFLKFRRSCIRTQTG
jgi:hypothetical protein